MFRTLIRISCSVLLVVSFLLVAGCKDDDPVAPPIDGTVVIDSAPDELNAQWALQGPNSLMMTGFGDTTLAAAAPGEYWVSWGPIDEWEEPDGYSQVLSAGATITFTGTYVELPLVPFADSPAQLMDNFEVVYEAMDLEYFGGLLHADHQFILHESTVRDFPGIGPTFDRAAELRIAERMFSGDPVIDPDGNLIPAISNIDVAVFWPLGGWQEVPAGQDFAGAQTAVFSTIIMMDRNGESTLNAQGSLQFYVTSRDSFYEGSVQQYYEIIGLKDLSDLKSIETITLGMVKALFR